jgi:hypothetical protein
VEKDKNVHFLQVLVANLAHENDGNFLFQQVQIRLGAPKPDGWHRIKNWRPVLGFIDLEQALGLCINQIDVKIDMPESNKSYQSTFTQIPALQMAIGYPN